MSKDYDEFLKLIKFKGIEVKHGKHIVFKLENLGQQRFRRGKTYRFLIIFPHIFWIKLFISHLIISEHFFRGF